MLENVAEINIPPVNTPKFSIGDFVGFNSNVYFGYVFGIGMIECRNYRFSWYYEVLPVKSIINRNCRKKLFTEPELSSISTTKKLPIEPNFSNYSIGEIVEDETGIARIISDVELHWQADFKQLLKKKIPLPSIYSYRLKNWNSNENNLSKVNEILITPTWEYY